MAVRAKAPLRIGLAGGGTDVAPYSDRYGGYVLNATIDMYAYCTLEALPREEVIFRALDITQEYKTRGQTRILLEGELMLHKAVYNRIVKQFNGGKPLGVCVTTYSDAPPGSGLGSSSTMVVAMLEAYREFLNLPLGEYEVAHLAYEIERIDVGLAGGKQDQYSATFGGFNFMEFYDDDRVIVNPLRVRANIINELNLRMFLYYTGQSRESAHIIQDQIKSVEGGDERSISAMHEVKQDAVRMKEFLLKGDFDGFARALGKAWESKKRMAKSISNRRIEEVYDAAVEAGAISGKISGAGGGGFMMFCVEPTRRPRVAAVLEKFGGKVMQFQFTGEGAQAWSV